MFTPPSQTRYDIVFHIAGIPVQVHPLFWVMALLFGASSGDFIQIVTWVMAVFVSILIHELGHAFAMRAFGQPSYIVLYHFGGLTIPTSANWGGRAVSTSHTSSERIIISLAGPFAGFLLITLILILVNVFGGLVFIDLIFGFLPFPRAGFLNGSWIINVVLQQMIWVNLFWGLINLSPVNPLDGGHVAQELFIKADPLNGLRKSLWLSVIAGAVICLFGFLILGSTYIALLFGILAGLSYQALQGRF